MSSPYRPFIFIRLAVPPPAFLSAKCEELTSCAETATTRQTETNNKLILIATCDPLLRQRKVRDHLIKVNILGRMGKVKMLPMQQKGGFLRG
jgi:hypothetical protein